MKKNILQKKLWQLIAGKRLGLIDRTELFQAAGENFWFFQEKEQAFVSNPICITEEQPVSSDDVMIIPFNKPFVCQINDAQMIGPKGFVLSSDGDIVEDTINNARLIDYLKKTPFRNISRKQPRVELEVATPLLNFWTDKFYFHWIVSSLLKLEGIDFFIEKSNVRPKLIIDKNAPEWQKESLDFLGYGEDYIELNEPAISVKQMVITPFRREKMVLSPSSLQWLREKAVSRLPANRSEYPKRIYITRKDAAIRQVLNEQEVLEYIKPLGFESFVLSEMSFAEQVALFSQAEIVLAPHGAGLTNTIFSSKILIMEFFASFRVPTFHLLSASLGHDYVCFQGEAAGEHIQVDLEVLRKAFSHPVVEKYL